MLQKPKRELVVHALPAPPFFCVCCCCTIVHVLFFFPVIINQRNIQEREEGLCDTAPFFLFHYFFNSPLFCFFATKHNKQTHHFSFAPLSLPPLALFSFSFFYLFFFSLLTCWRQVPIGRQFNCRETLLFLDAPYRGFYTPSLFDFDSIVTPISSLTLHDLRHPLHLEAFNRSCLLEI